MIHPVQVKLSRLTIQRFTAFESAEFDFSPGTNVFIGENGTGKSHVLKLLYALSEGVRRHVHGEGLDGLSPQSLALPELLAELLRGVFLPDELGRLVRRGVGNRSAVLGLTWDSVAALQVKLSNRGTVSATLSGDLSGLERAVFLPTREVLSLFPGFIETWLRRESNFDRTYYDLCLSLGLPPLRGARDAVRAELLAPLEHALQASVVVTNGKFYLRYEGGNMEAPLVAEGHRKLAMLAYLIVNGSLTKNGVMFWDEPEASMNPKLSTLTGEVVAGMDKLGVQTFLATHDYVLASDLSLAVAALPPGTRRTAFFALGRPEHAAVAIERGELFTDLQNNPILDAFAELNARERASQVAALTEHE